MPDTYRGIAPESVLSEVEALAAGLRGHALQHVNSTRKGGGVAELLARLVPMFESLGIRTRWDVIDGNGDFYDVTKSMHNALQGADVEFNYEDREIYLECLRENSKKLRLDADVVVIHDAQPAYLVDFCDFDRSRMVWRCHVDLAQPNASVWGFLSRAVSKYGLAIFHVPQFAQPLPIPQVLIPPSIDPLSEKNRELEEEQITEVTERFGIDRARPVVVQVSRFDRFKDPLGVIRAFRLVRQNFDCQLVLAGGTADDDPESAQVLAEVHEGADGDPDIFILSLPPDADFEINALQRAATVVMQKSTREGFGLTVTEAMWKGKPVVGGAAGGIPAQIIDRSTGFLVHSAEGAAFRLRYLLSHPKHATRMGKRGREHVRRNFLITRHLRDYLLVMHSVLRGCPESPIWLL
ncbi:MAG: glycosyltransferase [Candidatus Latescibacterota bacterium]|nr:MAG: glycosyltransferase [Candidatus Latescibacterota bacterium]